MGNLSPVSADRDAARFIAMLQTDHCLIPCRFLSLVHLPLRTNVFYHIN